MTAETRKTPLDTRFAAMLRRRAKSGYGLYVTDVIARLGCSYADAKTLVDFAIDRGRLVEHEGFTGCYRSVPKPKGPVSDAP